MGYTSYWKGRVDCSTTEWNQAMEEFLKVKEASGIPLADWDGTGLPKIVGAVDGPPRCYAGGVCQPQLSFNGVGEDSHETFRIEKGKEIEFDFCKTARKPYDTLVCAALIILKKHCPGLMVSSDGDAEDWKEGIEICQRVLGYGVYPCQQEKG